MLFVMLIRSLDAGQSVLIGAVKMKAVYLQSSFSLNIKEKGLVVK